MTINDLDLERAIRKALRLFGHLSIPELRYLLLDYDNNAFLGFILSGNISYRQIRSTVERLVRNRQIKKFSGNYGFKVRYGFTSSIYSNLSTSLKIKITKNERCDECGGILLKYRENFRHLQGGFCNLKKKKDSNYLKIIPAKNRLKSFIIFKTLFLAVLRMNRRRILLDFPYKENGIPELFEALNIIQEMKGKGVYDVLKLSFEESIC